jgi:anti-sigma regulatory factor (Ser/Thr protein kinase)
VEQQEPHAAALAEGSQSDAEQGAVEEANWLTRSFEASSAGVTAARRFTMSMLPQDRADRDVVALLVSELATNAVTHAGTAFAVAISLDADRTLVEVSDGSPVLPRLARDKNPLRERGRGLLVVGGLAVAWGCRRTPTGKTMWFETRAEPIAPA